MPRKPSGPRWVDGYKVPGQVVDVTRGDGPPFAAALASSPYATKAASADINASLIEIVACTGGRAEGLMAAAPGEQVHVSEVRGSGFAAIIDPETTLLTALEDKRPVLMLAYGAEGMAPLRSALEWAPLQAHASEAPVTLVYVADSLSSAAFLMDWDLWRGMGVDVVPLFLHPDGGGGPVGGLVDRGSADALVPGASVDSVSLDGEPSLEALNESDRMIVLFQEALFTERWKAIAGGKPKETIVLMSGIPKPVSAALVRFLSHHRVPTENILLS